MPSNTLEEILKNINAEKVRLKESDKSANNDTLKKVLDAVEEEFKKDTLFKAMFTQRRYGGSYFEGLKVSSPDEYDMNFVLKMPRLAACDITTQEEGDVRIYVNIEEINRQEYLKNYRRLSELLDNFGYLSVRKTNSWFQGLVDTAIKNLSEKKFDVSLGRSSSGPARTLFINNTFCIDLVPAFWMDQKYWPKNYVLSELQKEFLIIPKPIEDKPTYWRCSFYEHEKELLRNMGRVKETIRLLKSLRDECNHLCQIKSYYIKTIFLLEKPKYDISYRIMRLDEMFLKMLEKLEVRVRSGIIPFYWNRDLNLLRHNQNTDWNNIANSLKDIRLKIKADPSKAYYYFNVDVDDQLSRDLSDITISDEDDEGAVHSARPRYDATPRQRNSATTLTRNNIATEPLQEEMSLEEQLLLGGAIVSGVAAVIGFSVFGILRATRQNDN